MERASVLALSDKARSELKELHEIAKRLYISAQCLCPAQQLRFRPPHLNVNKKRETF